MGCPNPLQQPWPLLPVILLGWSPPPGCSDLVEALFRGSILILRFTRGRGEGNVQPWLCSLGPWCLLLHPWKRYSSSIMPRRSGTTSIILNAFPCSGHFTGLRSCTRTREMGVRSTMPVFSIKYRRGTLVTSNATTICYLAL